MEWDTGTRMANLMGRVLLRSLAPHSSCSCRAIAAAPCFSSAASSSQASSSARGLDPPASNFHASVPSLPGSVRLSSGAGSCVFPSHLPRLLLSTKTSSSDDAEDPEDAPLPGESFVSSFTILRFCGFFGTFALLGGSGDYADSCREPCILIFTDFRFPASPMFKSCRIR